VHLGVASHNLFDLAHGLVLREERGVLPWVEFEMLEGMADHQARVVRAHAGGLLLYAPVVRAEDFTSAIAYLVRRLDENTAEDNFLRHVFGLEPGSPEWARERERFLAAFALIDSVSDAPRRTQDRAVETRTGGDSSPPFRNEPDTDWSLAANRRWIAEVMEQWRDRVPESVPLQIGGELIARGDQIEGRDRSRPARIAYLHAVADRALVNRALDAARAALPAWAGRSPDKRRALLDRAVAVFASRRDDLIGAMIVDGAKTIAEADPEVSEAIDFARYYARAFDHVGDLRECRMQPLGVVVVAPPWNFPLSIPAGGVLAALAAGNVAILKPAPEAVLVGWHLAQALWDAGVPRDALAFLPSPDGEVGRGLITDPRVDAVILTGSVETARRFLAWRPDLRLFAETSGKNAMIVTALSDRDQAIRDLVRSAFGHNGQKCSAASLAICEAEVYDDAVFRRQLRDAAASLPVGSAWDAWSRVTPLTQRPGDALFRALTTLDEGEEWLLAPRPLDAEGSLWSPGIKLGVRRGSFFHVTECFGPVLGLMRAEHLDEAIDLANGTPFGLTSGIQSLDDREVERWIDRVEAGNLYVNRPITGAIVGRQPFGGWKGSSVGPGAKAGGPNYVLQLARWEQVALPRGDDHVSDGADSLSRADGSTGGADRMAPAAHSMPLGAESTPRVAALVADCLQCVEGDAAAAATLRASAASYATAWREHFARGHDPSALRGEENVFRYRPCRAIAVRADPSEPAQRTALLQVILAALTADVPLVVSLARGDVWPWLAAHPGVTVTVETEAALIDRLRARDVERLRVVGSIGADVRTATHESGVAVIDAPVLATGRLELRWYLREQTVTRVRHRYGNVIEPAGTE